MFYIIIYLILSSSISIHSQERWKIFHDRLDLLIKDSFLIIQCNNNEIQIARLVTTFDELESNFQCTNKVDLFQHGNERVQITDFKHYKIKCKSNTIQLEGYFYQIKKSLNKNDNGIDWPFVRTSFNEINQDPIKMKFYDENKLEIILNEININELENEKTNISVYLDFVNRPMVCFIRIENLEKQTSIQNCDANIAEKVIEPTCYYKAGEGNTPSHDELDDIADKAYHYVKNMNSKYVYISDMDDFNSNNENTPGKRPLKSKSGKDSSVKNKTKKTSSLTIRILILIFIICLIIIIGMIYFIKKKSINKLLKEKSNISNESQISNSTIQSQYDSSSNINNTKRTATDWFTLDDEI